MASFEQAYNLTLRYEGGYQTLETAKKIADSGGETYAGISRVYHPTWSGWYVLDKISSKKQGQKFPQLESEVKSFYKKDIWDKNKFGDITNQQLANNIYDFTVNSGSGSKTKWGAINQVQKILRISVDGVSGNDTISAINKYPDPIELNNKIAEARASVIRNSNKIQGNIKPQLIDRATSFTQQVYEKTVEATKEGVKTAKKYPVITTVVSGAIILGMYFTYQYFKNRKK